MNQEIEIKYMEATLQEETDFLRQDPILREFATVLLTACNVSAMPCCRSMTQLSVLFGSS
jgi:hypothetical protein